MKKLHKLIHIITFPLLIILLVLVFQMRSANQQLQEDVTLLKQATNQIALNAQNIGVIAKVLNPDIDAPAAPAAETPTEPATEQ